MIFLSFLTKEKKYFCVRKKYFLCEKNLSFRKEKVELETRRDTKCHVVSITFAFIERFIVFFDKKKVTKSSVVREEKNIF